MRTLPLGVGAALGAICVLVVALTLPVRTANRAGLWPKVGCHRSPVLRVEWICGRNVIYVNPDGSRVLYKNGARELHMPRPRPVLTRGG